MSLVEIADNALSVGGDEGGEEGGRLGDEKAQEVGMILGGMKRIWVEELLSVGEELEHGE